MGYYIKCIEDIQCFDAKRNKPMNIDYVQYSKIFKVFSDPKRLKIIDMLSNGERCACKIQEEFNITQPTLSHDMKLLCDIGVVTSTKEGKWMHYSLNMEKMNEIYKMIGILMVPDGFQKMIDCDCK